MTLTEKSTHVADAQAHLISMFRRRTDLDKFIDALVTELAELEVVAFDILDNTLTVGATTGANLDHLGRLVGVEREGRTDLIYDVRIAAQILLNNGSGTIEDLIALIDAMTGGAATMTVIETFPAEFEIDVTSILTAGLGVEVGALVGSGKPAGVGGQFSFFESTPEFIFDSGIAGLDLGLLSGVVGF